MIQNSNTKKVYERLPIYLDYLNKLDQESVSSTFIAQNLNLGEVQVRKDLALVSGKGRPKVGYLRQNLINDIIKYMGFDHITKAIIIGFGRLGRALYEHTGFDEFGIELVQAFDIIPSEGVLSIEELENYCLENKILFAVLAVPNNAAQEITDRLVKSNVLGIWNFTTVRLQVPKHVIIQNENLATSLSVLVKVSLDNQLTE